MECLHEIKIIESPHMAATVRTQWRFPRSKRVRIRKKWAKRQENWRDCPVFWKVAGIGLVAHPSVMGMLKADPRVIMRRSFQS